MSDLLYEWRAFEDEVVIRLLNFEDGGPDTIRLDFDQNFLSAQTPAWLVTLNAEVIAGLCDVYALKPTVNTKRIYDGLNGRRVGWTITCRLKYEVMEMVRHINGWVEVPHGQQTPA